MLSIYPVKINPERITQENKKLVNSFNYDGIEFLVGEKGFSKIEKKNSSCINVLCHDIKLTFTTYLSDQKCKNSMNLLLVINEKKSHMTSISKILTDFCLTKQRINTKSTFVKVVYSVSVVKMC